MQNCLFEERDTEVTKSLLFCNLRRTCARTLYTNKGKGRHFNTKERAQVRRGESVC